jgi:hypothetical protein
MRRISINEQYKWICLASGMNALPETRHYAICLDHDGHDAIIFWGNLDECQATLPMYEASNRMAEICEITTWPDVLKRENQYYIFGALRQSSLLLDFKNNFIADGVDIYKYVNHKELIFLLSRLLKKQLDKKGDGKNE